MAAMLDDLRRSMKRQHESETAELLSRLQSLEASLQQQMQTIQRQPEPQVSFSVN